jgi:cellulose biosynthesis protein BcsQ
MTVQEIIWIATLTAVLVGGIDWLLRLWFEHRARSRPQTPDLAATINDLNQRVLEAAAERQQLTEERNALQGQIQESAETLITCRAERDELEGQRDAAQAEATDYQQRLQRAEELARDYDEQLHRRAERHTEEVGVRDERIRELTGDLDRERERAEQGEGNAGRLTKELGELNKQIEGVIKQDERVWERTVAGASFLPLTDRKVPIIAILNLKGGVGKTTITANLAGLMAQKGKKVLVIDADYQRNLSMLLVSDKDRRILHLERRTLQHFLSGRSSLFYTASEVSGLAGCWVVTNSDALKDSRTATDSSPEDIGLEDVEMRLMAEWMFCHDAPDIRLRLRDAMQPRLKEKDYHYVLIDCPPRLSTSCINALAASDFFLVPVLLDATSARSVPNLLRTLRRLRGPTIFPHLSCLGIVANEVSIRGGRPIAREARIWDQLPAVCRHPDAWGSDVHLFGTMIPDNGRIAEAAGLVFGERDGPCLALGDTEIKGVFAALLREFETRIAHESKRLATVPA